MSRYHILAAALLLSLLFVGGCAGNQPSRPSLPEQNTRLVFPVLPQTTCADSPAPPALDATDNEWAGWKARDHDAGQDCRDKLKAIHDVQSKWPRTDADPR
jgi:hypothetical protein